MYKSIHEYPQYDIYGFKDQFTVARVAEYGYPISLGTIGIPGCAGNIAAFPAQFKLLLPPGVGYIGTTCYMPVDSQQGFCLRYANLPDALYINDPFDEIPWNDPRLIPAMEGEDSYGKNRSGHTYAIITQICNPLLTEAQWFYFQRIYNGYSVIHKLNQACEINMDLYETWYNGCEWDENGNPILGGEPPSPPTNPDPEHNASGISVDTHISWSDGGGATSYDIYFGTNPIPGAEEFKGNQEETTYDPNTLNYETAYYWGIVAKNAHGSAPGDVWNFLTGSEPPPPPPPPGPGRGFYTLARYPKTKILKYL